MTNELLLEALKGAAVGGLIGYLTNKLAVSMLFHPRRPWKILGLPVPLTPGLVVKNQERLAEAIGNAVARDLLDAETLTTHLQGVDLAGPISAVLQQERNAIAASERSLAEILGPGHRAALEKVRDTVAADLTRRAGELATRFQQPGSPAHDAFRRVLDDAANTPISQFFVLAGSTEPPDLVPLRNWAIARLDDYAAGESCRAHCESVISFLLSHLPDADVFERLEEIARDTLAPRLPELTGRAQQAIADYIASPDFEHQARDPLAERLYALIVAKFPMATMLINQRTITELLEQKWGDIAAAAREIVEGEDFARFLSGQIEDSVAQLLRVLREQLAEPDTRARLSAMLAEQAEDALRRWLAGNEAPEMIDQQLAKLSAKSLAEICGGNTAWLDNLASVALEKAGGWLRGEDGRAWLSGLIRDGAEHLLFRKPMRELMEFLPEAEWDAISVVLGELFEQRTHRVLPTVLRDKVDLAAVVSEKIRVFDTAQMEAVILRVSGRELKGIVRLGGLIGIIVGATTQVFYWWLG